MTANMLRITNVSLKKYSTLSFNESVCVPETLFSLCDILRRMAATPFLSTGLVPRLVLCSLRIAPSTGYSGMTRDIDLLCIRL